MFYKMTDVENRLWEIENNFFFLTQKDYSEESALGYKNVWVLKFIYFLNPYFNQFSKTFFES